MKLAANIFFLCVFMAAIIYITIQYGPEITRLVSKPDKFRDLLNSYGYQSVPLFILLQVLQVVVAAIPGELVQIAGGYIYGTLPGTLYLMCGAVIGTVIVFYASRLLGYPLVRMFVPQNKLDQFNFIINSSKSEVAIFILFLIPGVPKDILTYIAGLTPVKPLKFIVTASLARFPALIASAYIGSNIQQRNYLTVIILSVVAVLLFAAGMLLKDRIIDRMQSLVHKHKSRSGSPDVPAGQKNRLR